MPRRFQIRFACFAFLLFLTCHAFGQFAGIKTRVPRGANAIVVLDVDMIYRSPQAQKENWRDHVEKAHACGLTILPPQANQFLMAAELDFEFMEPIWEVALANVSYQPSIPKIAAKWNGSVDRIGERSVARLAEDAYVVPFGKNMIGSYRPGNRQSVGRWLRDTDIVGDRLSKYLQQALSYTENNKVPIILALDLQHVISPALAAKRLEEGKWEVDIQKVAKAISTIQGLTMAITINERSFGAIKLDFEENVEFMKDVAKPILLSVLAKNSAMIDEFQDWKVKAKGNRIQVSGPLYRSGLQRILSVLDAPSAVQQQATEPASPNGAPTSDQESLVRLSSQQYFNSVSGLVDDLSEKPKKTEVKTMGQVGVWFGRYAKKIDSLPLLNVDPALLDYGKFVSNSFRRAEDDLRSAGGKSRVAQLNSTATVGNGDGYGYGYGYYGYRGRWAYGNRATLQHNALMAVGADRARIRTEVRVSTAADARGIMQDISSATADIRRSMTEKYQVEF